MGNIGLIRQYKNDIKKGEADLESLKKASSITNSHIVSKKREIGILKFKLEKILTREVAISDHALLRYIERVKGVDIESIKEEMLKDSKIIDAIKILNSGTFPIQGCSLIVKDNIITTIIID